MSETTSTGRSGSARRVLLVAHPRRAEARALARGFGARLHEQGIEVAITPGEAEELHLDGSSPIVVVDAQAPAAGCELVCVLGGDGTILRGAALSRGTDAPLLGVNLGHVGFLAEAEREELKATADRIVAKDYSVEERLTLDVRASLDGRLIAESWALNEVSVEKAARERMLEMSVEVDGRPLSSWGCDGIIMATPTGSTAYAFSAGGPVVWPDVEALLLVPISAHALFARPLVTGPSSRLAVEISGSPDLGGGAVMWCDGARMVELPPGSRVEVARSTVPVRLARLSSSPFTDRLVAKFHLSVVGWRGAAVGAGRPVDLPAGAVGGHVVPPRGIGDADAGDAHSGEGNGPHGARGPGDAPAVDVAPDASRAAATANGEASAADPGRAVRGGS